jgi:hypothetical protein
MRELMTRKEFENHGRYMFILESFYITSFVLIMAKSFVLLLSVYSGVFLWIHAIGGSIGLLMGLWVVYVWKSNGSIKICFQNKNKMRITILAWILALFSGIGLYYSLYLT